MALPAFTFDTHKLVCKLKGAGFNDQQAEALTDAVQESQASLNVATKQDVVDVRRDMEQGFADVRREMSDMKFVLIKWIVGLGLAQTGLWFTLKLFPIGS